MALDRQQIVCEAVALLDAEGLDGVTTRKLATRLGVQSPTLYWHLPNKAALITALADTILLQEFEAPEPRERRERWQDWLTEFALRLRRALIAHRDGARVMSAAQLSTSMNALSELAMSTLAGAGVPLRQSRVIVLAVERFTFGYVLEEQAPKPDAADGLDPADYLRLYPTMTSAITEYFAGGSTVDDLFRECLGVVIRGADTTASAAG